MVDWSLARQVARLASGDDRPEDLGVDMPGLVESMEPRVADATGLVLASMAPEPELVSRAQWVEMNLGSLAELLDPVAGRLDSRLEGGTGPFAGALKAGAGATLAAEAGLVMGYVSTRVLGQYELSLLAPEAPPRLVFVTPNLAGAARDLKVDRDSFYAWIAIHELTHVFQFQGVPWLREHLGGLIREYMDTVEVRIESGAAGGMPLLPHPAKLVEAFREGGLMALVQTREQRRLMRRIQSAMAVVEGYSELVMDRVAAQVLPGWPGLRDALERRRRSRSAPERILERLLGLDLKMRQYEQGRGFCEAVAGEHGMPALNRVWEGPEALPGARELQRPDDWLERVRSAPLAASA